MQKLLYSKLNQFFQYNTFLGGQEEVVTKIAAGEQMCVIMPTGSGKSLCFQLPALLKDGYTLVVSPLISLMKDQVDALKQRNIPAAFLNSTQTFSEQQTIISEVLSGSVKLLYIAPERLHSKSFHSLVHNLQPEMLVVDEAHCISQWGHDFRTDYIKIGKFLEHWNVSQVCCFTATATPVVQEDIVRQIRRNLSIFVTGYTRPNLALSVIPSHKKDDKLKRIKSLIDDSKPTIIYASTRDNVDLISDELECIRYHAGMSDADRTDAQNRFMNDQSPVIAATNAFGMGIDRPDIRQVIHFNIPGSLEAYYQEAGRAGRDGEDSACILLFSEADRFTHKFLIEINNLSKFIVLETYQTLLHLSDDLDSYYLEVSVSQLASMVSSAKGDRQISNILKILEKNGYIDRGYRQQNKGLLRSNRSIRELQEYGAGANTQRSIFVQRILHYYGSRVEEGFPCSYEELVSVTKFDSEKVKRALRALNGNELIWVPPFTGRSITLLKPEVKIPDLDYKELENKVALEKQRLDEMLLYPRERKCRQKFIIDYFGQKNDDWLCQVCDLCKSRDHADKRLPTESELDQIITILRGTFELHGGYGKNKVAQYLYGSRRQEILKVNLHHYPSYGLLKTIGQSTILRLMDTLINQECIKIIGDKKYPRISITPLGRDVIEKKQSIAFELHDFDLNSSTTESTPSSRKRNGKKSKSNMGMEDSFSGVDNGNDDLYERLRIFRNDMAAEKRLIPYQIVTNRTLQEMSLKAPMTVDEAKGIHGIGRKKEKTILPKFIEEINNWRKESAPT